MDYLTLLRQYPRYLSFGFLHYFFSGFGQTFLISFFVPYFNEAFAIDNIGFGYLYSGATLLSAFTLPFAGTLIDRYSLRWLSVGNGLMLCLFCLMVAFAPNYWVLLVALYGLRFTGQGYMVLIGSTSLARYFSKVRGKALSLASLGLSFSEGILPSFVTVMVGLVGWRDTWMLIPVALLSLFLPLSLSLVGQKDEFQKVPEHKAKENGEKQDATRGEVVRDPKFWILATVSVFLPFFITGMFLHQNLLAEIKGWTMEWMSTCFFVFFISRLIAYFLAGPLIDRFTARRVFVFYLVPLMLGALSLLFTDHKLIAMVYLFLTGITASLATVTNTAMWVEIYGTDHLGAIKSVVTTFMVMATALGAVVMGPLLEQMPLSVMISGSAVLMVILIGMAYGTVRKVEARF